MKSQKFITQLPAIFILTLGSLILSPTIVNSQGRPPQEVIDDWTDSFFYSANPQLSGRKLRAGETEYIREWNAIQRVVPDILIYRNQGCGDGFSWDIEHYDDPSPARQLISEDVDKVADAVFYARYPELGYRKIQPGETVLANEWMRIRRSVSYVDPDWRLCP